MRNGIKKLFLTSLFVIFGMCFNSSFGYTQIDNCYTSTSNANRHWVCRIFERDEIFKITSTTTEWTTITFWAKLDTNWKPMFIVNNVFELNSKQRDSNSILYYNQSWYYNYFQSLWNIGENDSYEIYSFELNKLYCAIESWDSAMYQKCSQPPKWLWWTSTVNDINEYIWNAVMTWYRITFADRTTIYTWQIYAVCPMFDNWFEFCIQFDSSYNNALSAQWTRTKLDWTRDSSEEVLAYLSNNYPIYDTPFTINWVNNTTTETTPILWQCPTIKEILSTYSSNYNTWICYSATRLLTQTWIVNTTAQSIFELYPTFTWWLEDYNYYRQYCENVPTSVCREAFSWNEIKWSLLNKTPENNPIGVYQYCHLQLNIEDKNATTCVLSTWSYYATWVDEAIEEEIQWNQSVLDIMLNSFNNLKEELPSFSSGTVFDEFLEEWETWKDGFKLDIFKTFLELWSKITSIFIFRNQYDGIIPTYITSIIVIILLFKILKK